MHDKLFHDDLVFDRLVDKELSAAERRELLASLDDRPDGWRRCALAFLEAQCWRENLGQFVGQPELAAVNVQKAKTSSASTPAARGSHRAAWLAVAAGVVVAFTLGLMWPHRNSPIADKVQQDRSPQLAEEIPPASLPDAERLDDALTLWVRDQTGQARPVHVPLVDAGTLDRQLGLQFQSGVPSDVRSRLQDQGFDVQSKRRYAPLWLENGRPMILPVEDTKIVPVSRDVY